MKHPTQTGRKLLSLLLALMMLVSALPVSVFAAETGKFALFALDAEEQLIEPSYVSYKPGQTVKDALKESGHTFTGIDQGFITAIDGHEAPYTLHYDKGGYDLSVPASAVETALWFTTNASQDYSDGLLHLVAAMAKYNTADNGVKDYAAARTAYQNAVKGFDQADNAKAQALCDALTGAMQRYADYLKGDTVAVTLSATLGGRAVTPQKADFLGEFGNKVSVKNTNTVNLVPGRYDYVLTHDDFRHVRGSITVSGSTTIKAAFPEGQWVKEVTTGIDSYWTNFGEMKRGHATASGATFYIPDFAPGDLYTCLVPSDETIPDTYGVYAPGNSSNRGWNSQASLTADVYPAKSLEDASFDYEIRAKSGDTDAYQTFTMNLVRTPSLKSLTVTGDGTQLTLPFDRSTLSYALTTTSQSVDVTAVPLCEDASVAVNGRTVSGSAHVELKDCQSAGEGKFALPVTVSAPNGQQTTYTLTITQLGSVAVTLQHAADVTVEVFTDAGASVAAQTTGAKADTFRLIPGARYTYLASKQEFYHSTADFQAAEGKTVAVAEPHVAAAVTNLEAKPTSSDSAPAYDMTPAFQAETHRYEVLVESNSSNFWLAAPSVSDANYTTTAYYNRHLNGSQPGTPYARSFPNTAKAQNMTNFMAVGGWGNELRLELREKAVSDGVSYYQDYFIKVSRQMTINDLRVSDNTGIQLPLTQKDSDPAQVKYTKLVTDYTLKVGQGLPSLTLSLKPMSSVKVDDSCTVVLTCGAWTETVPFGEEHRANSFLDVTVPLHTEASQETLQITISHAEPTAQSTTYTVDISKMPPVKTTFTVTPADASVFLTDDVTHAHILPNEDGTYTLSSGAAYTCNVTKPGFVGQALQFVAGPSEKTQTVTLKTAPASTHPNIAQKGDWPQFRGGIDNNGIVHARTPIRAEDTTLVWANRIGTSWSNAVGCPIIVGGDLYAYSGKEILKISAETGEILLHKPMAGASSFAINSPTYGGGMIFVALSNGGVQAFDATTLDSLWVYFDPLKGQCNCPLAYADGRVFTGFWNSETKEASFVCLTATDEDPTKTDETKLASWTYPGKGFYWAGAYVSDQFLLVPTDDGESGYTKGHGDLLSLDPRTGEIIEKMTMPGVGDLRSSICAANDAYYFTSKGGDFYEIRVNSDGTFVPDSLRRLHLDNGTDDPNTPPMSTSTPVVSNGRAYIGVSGASQFGSYGGHNMTVIDLDSFTVAYTVPTAGYPQTSGLLTTAYEDTEHGGDGYTYVYFIDNMTPGYLRVLRDKPGMTAPDPTYMTPATITSGDTETTVNAGYILFTPQDAQAQYAICSPISDSQGNLYFKNDSGYMMRVSSTVQSLEVTHQPDRTAYKTGEVFDPAGLAVTAHYANGATRDITAYLDYSTEPLTENDSEITLSYDLDKLLQLPEVEGQPRQSYWNLYQDKDNVPGTPYDLPTASVALDLTAVPSAPVTVSLEQDNFYPVPPQKLSVSADLSDTYGYADQITDGVSALDALIAVHQILLAEAFTPETKDDFLSVNDQGFITKMMGEETSNVGFAVNGRMPNDGVLNESYGSYTGYSLNQTRLAPDDVVQFFFYNPDGYYGEIYTNFVKDGQHVTSFTVPAGLEQKLQVQGYSYMYEGCNPEIKWKNVTDIQVCLLAAEGENAGMMTPIQGALTDENGMVRITFPAAGTYTLAVTSDPDNFTYVIPQLCTVTVTEPTEDEKAAIAVNELIGAIGPVTPDKAQAVADARKAYEDLTPAQQKLVTRLDLLEAAEAQLEQAGTDKAAAEKVIALIDEIGTVTPDRKAAVQAARQAYDGLTDAQKALVTNLETLTAAEAKLAQLEQAAADKAAAEKVTALIDEIGTVTPDRKAAVQAARQAYDGLTDAQKALVTNLETLTAAEAKLAQLEADRDAAQAVDAKITAIGTVTGRSEEAILSARQAYDGLTDAQKSLVTKLEALTQAETSFRQALKPQAKLTIKPSSGKPYLTWNAVEGAAQYEVYCSINGGEFQKIYTTKTGTRMTNTSAQPGDARTYYVVATAALGTVGEPCQPMTEICRLAAPDVKVTARQSDGAPVLTWEKQAYATNYQVWVSESKDGPYTKLITAKGTKVTHGSAKAGHTYFYKAVAINTENEQMNSAESTVVTMTVKTPLDAPTARLSIVSSTGKPRLTWTHVDGAVKYEVYRAVGKNGQFKMIYDTKTGSRMTNTSAVAGKTYYYKVCAVAEDGTRSAFSATKHMTCDCGRPTVKVSLRSDGTPVLRWNKIDGATGYEVYRATSRDGSYTKLITAKGTQLTNGSAKAGVTYFYKVRAVCGNRYAAGAFSSVVSIRAK